MCCKACFLFVVLLIGILAMVYVIYQFYSFIRCGCGKYGPFVSSSGKLKDDILNEARDILKKSKKPLKVTDLGCGSGALLLPLAKEFPKHQFIGVEWDIVPLTMGKIKAQMAGLTNITFKKDNYMKASHADMDLILCYVLKVTGEPLGKKLAAEIKDTAVVISEMFPLGHLEEVKQVQSSLWGVPEKYFVYKKPLSSQSGAKKEADKAKTKKADIQVKVKKEAVKTKTNKTEKKPLKTASAKNKKTTKTEPKTKKKVVQAKKK